MLNSGACGAANLLVDAHVHVHPVFELSVVLNGARDNFEGAAAELELDPGESWLGVLLLTEAAGADRFETLAEHCDREGSARVGGWCLRRVGPLTLRAEPSAASMAPAHVGKSGAAPARALLLVSGYQIATRDGLEVLALGTRTRTADGLPLDASIEAAGVAGALPVIPWGFGKWSGRRGAIVEKLLSGRDAGTIWLGDNGGRSKLLRSPPLFGRAAELGMPVLRGSDPLPFKSHERRAGSYGFHLRDAPLDVPHPTSDARTDDPIMRLFEQLRARAQPRGFGRRAGVLAFARDQVAMQLRKRSGRR